MYSDCAEKVLAMPGVVDPMKEEVEEIDGTCPHWKSKQRSWFIPQRRSSIGERDLSIITMVATSKNSSI